MGRQKRNQKIREEERGFRKLRVWQEAHELVKMVYRETKKFPKQELFCLTSQLRRAAISVPANVVEGYAYRSDKKLLQHLHIADGSLAEVEYYLILAEDLGFVGKEDYLELEEQRRKIGAYLTKFIKAIKQRS
ncbi:four helix bundle protein [Candidatus Microgenomates bacterium]|nr:four helix bundle protein [Candidatus Microgenomates bacterium]